MCEQITLLDIIRKGPSEAAQAICCMDGEKLPAQLPTLFQRRLVPKGEYVVSVGKYPLVLEPAKITPEQIPPGHAYHHYLIGGELYTGIFIGNELTKEEAT